MAGHQKELFMALATVHDRAVRKAILSMGGKSIADIEALTGLSKDQAEASLGRLFRNGEARLSRRGLWYPLPL
jgi:hypothetical protein